MPSEASTCVARWCGDRRVVGAAGRQHREFLLLRVGGVRRRSRGVSDAAESRRAGHRRRRRRRRADGRRDRGGRRIAPQPFQSRSRWDHSRRSGSSACFRARRTCRPKCVDLRADAQRHGRRRNDGHRIHRQPVVLAVLLLDFRSPRRAAGRRHVPQEHAAASTAAVRADGWIRSGAIRAAATSAATSAPATTTAVR